MSITDSATLLESGREQKIMPLTQVIPEPLDRIVSFWHGLSHSDRATPRYDQLDLLDLVEFLPHMAVLELDEAQADFTYRYYGTSVVAMTGFDPTGLALSEIGGEGMGKKWQPVIRHVVGTRNSYMFRTVFGEIDRSHVVANCLIAPLCDRQGRTTHFLAYAEPRDEAA